MIKIPEEEKRGSSHYYVLYKHACTGSIIAFQVLNMIKLWRKECVVFPLFVIMCTLHRGASFSRLRFFHIIYDVAHFIDITIMVGKKDMNVRFFIV